VQHDGCSDRAVVLVVSQFAMIAAGMMLTKKFPKKIGLSILANWF
jgi:hypothetical protein